MQFEYNNPFGFDYNIGNQQRLNNTNTDELRKKYNLTHREMDECTTQTITRFGSYSTIENLESYIKAQGYIAIEEPQTEIYNQREIKISENVILPSLEYCQNYWRTTQSNIVVPSKHINSTKKPPISTVIGFSAMSGKQGVNTIDGTGKGARIMSIKRINKLYKNLTETRKIKPRTIESHIRKLIKLKTNSDNIIQAYIVFLWNCRNGWSQLTREQMSQHLGLTQHSDKQAKIIMDKLVLDGFIEQRSKYQGVQVVDKVTGIPKTITKPYYEYRVVTLDEVDNEEE